MIYNIKDTKYSCKIDLRECTYSYGEWKIFQMPYKHICVCIEKASRSLYHFTDNYFHAEIYRAIYTKFINSIFDIKLSQSTSDEIHILPSILKTYLGRPRKKRRASQMDSSRNNSCGQCGKE